MTRLGRSLIITGELTSDEDIAIDGTVRGHILVRAAALTIGEHAEVEAEVRCVRVDVRGRFKGTLSASERIQLHPSAVVAGDLSANQVVIADGAQFGGRIDMDQRTIAARVARFKAEQGAQR